MFGCNAIEFGFIEVEYNRLGAILNHLPLASGELRQEVDHRTEGRSSIEFWGIPCVPIADG